MPDVIQASIQATQPSYIELQKAQLHAGLNVDQQLIGDTTPYASELYAEVKEQQNPLPGFGNPDLYREGHFYDGVETTVTKAKVKVESRDSKNKKLQEHYPGALAGIGGIYLEEYAKVLKPTMIKQIQK